MEYIFILGRPANCGVENRPGSAKVLTGVSVPVRIKTNNQIMAKAGGKSI